MDRERWVQVKNLFAEARAIAPRDRGAWIDSRCGSDRELRSELESLLRFHDDGSDSESPTLCSDPPRLIGVPMGSSAPEATGVGNDLPVGTRLGAYRILGVLGRGGMGVVYEAEQDAPRRSVALKVLPPGSASPAALRRFQSEAQALARLQHPGIAQIYEAGTISNSTLGLCAYIAMERVCGVSLNEFVRREKLGTPRRLELFARVCDAVHYAHGRGVIHRDLKPGNILVDELGQPKILDFGVARLTEHDLGGTLATHAGQLVGTIPYMSPEQASGNPDAVDERTDVYILGAVLYELLIGRTPHDLERRTLPEILRALSEDDPVPVGSIDRALRGDLQTITTRALEKDKARRYQSAKDLGDDLRRYLRDEPILAVPVTVLYRLSKFVRRNRVVVGSAALLMVTVAVAVGATTWQARNVRLASERTRAATRTAGLERAARARELFATCNKLRTVTGARELQRSLLEQAHAQLAALAEMNPADLESNRYVWLSLRQMGEAYLALGETDRAREFFNRFFESVVEARKAYPDELNLRHDLALAYYRLGDLAAGTGNLSEARANYDRCREAATELYEMGPDEPRFIEMMACSITGDANLAMMEGNLRESLAHVRKKLELELKLVERQPDSMLYRNWLAQSYARLADFAREDGDLPEARDYYMRALETLERIVAEEPHNADARYRVAYTLSRLGDFSLRANETTAAGDYYQRAVVANSALVAVEPKNNTYQRSLATSLEALGRHHAINQRTDEAAECYRRSIEIIGRLADGEPDNLHLRALRASGYFHLGDLARDRGALDEAEANYRSMIEVIEPAAKADVSIPQYREYLAKGRRALSAVLWQLGRKDEARTHMVLAIEVLRGAADSDQADATSLSNFAMLLLRCKPDDLRDPRAALEYARRAVELSKGNDPGLLHTLAAALRANGDLDAAIDIDQGALDLLPAEPSRLRRRIESALQDMRDVRDGKPSRRTRAGGGDDE